MSTPTTPLSPRLSRLFIGALLVAVTALLSVHIQAQRPNREHQLAQDFSAQIAQGQAPDIEVIRQDGSKLRLSQLRGKVVFVNFWAT